MNNPYLYIERARAGHQAHWQTPDVVDTLTNYPNMGVALCRCHGCVFASWTEIAGSVLPSTQPSFHVSDIAQQTTRIRRRPPAIPMNPSPADDRPPINTGDI